jgi:hypothetical protein
MNASVLGIRMVFLRAGIGIRYRFFRELFAADEYFHWQAVEKQVTAPR